MKHHSLLTQFKVLVMFSWKLEIHHLLKLISTLVHITKMISLVHLMFSKVLSLFAETNKSNLKSLELLTCMKLPRLIRKVHFLSQTSSSLTFHQLFKKPEIVKLKVIKFVKMLNVKL